MSVPIVTGLNKIEIERVVSCWSDTNSLLTKENISSSSSVDSFWQGVMKTSVALQTISYTKLLLHSVFH